MNPTAEQLASFLWFIRNIMGITTDQLPDASGFIPYALTTALQYVSDQINNYSPLLYTQALNNFAGDWLINYAPDNASATVPANKTFFTTTRTGYKINNFSVGIVQSAADESTSDALTVPDFVKGLTMQNLQQIKTPYGRQYMAITQELGPVWGMS
jgi:hypothetical protein